MATPKSPAADHIDFTREEKAAEASLPLVDVAEEKALLRKIDLHLLPILWVLYLCAFIDRVNIGNARIQGLEADLNMTGSDYNVALFVFFIPYILLEVPSNMILKKLRPSIYLPGLMVGWGVITICQGVTESFAGLVVCRFLIGFFEAGFFPGLVYLISMFYCRTEFQWRLNLLFSAAILAGAVSGLLAYAIAQMDGVAGYSGWRWIFILEGLATVLIALTGFLFVSDWPESAKFLSTTERELVARRLTVGNADNFRMDSWNKKAARRMFLDIKIWLGAAMFLGVTTTNYAFAFFTPTILKQLGWTSLRAQIMSIPIWCIGCVAALGSAYLSDRLQHRYGFIMTGIFVMTIGYALLLALDSIPVAVRYFALYVIIAGSYLTQPITIGWLSNNLGGHYKRGIGAAMQVGIGNLSGFVGSNIFLATEAPTYKTGFSVGLVMVWICAVSATAFLLYILRENRIRAEGGRDDRYNLPDDEKMNLGDDHPRYRFIA